MSGDEYRCMWGIDVVAESPREAAAQARSMQLDSDAWVGVFQVQRHGEEGWHDIDLDQDDAPLDPPPIRTWRVTAHDTRTVGLVADVRARTAEEAQMAAERLPANGWVTENDALHTEWDIATIEIVEEA